MKNFSFSLLIIGLTLLVSSYSIEPIPSKKLSKLLSKDWKYEYSIHDGVKTQISNDEFINGLTNVFFKIEFWKYSKKDLQLFYMTQHSDYKSILKGNLLEGIEMFGDYKGCTEYPILLSDSTDVNGFIVECKIQTYSNCGNGAPIASRTFYIDRLTKDTLIISGYLGETKANKIIYSRMK